jgi:hypothetical protein
MARKLRQLLAAKNRLSPEKEIEFTLKAQLAGRRTSDRIKIINAAMRMMRDHKKKLNATNSPDIPQP